ncbi:alpha/beta hydrolase [Microbacter margulisiae]|uniref:Pimeloyl-ACP methyl ester carboxylesterase n=1 Tax=Microbacter margulisiae TaxID=1350067 RepID=A0A7W5DN00_9PORP|nr:alpha/beta hydrolase [Microbacter margulisiae]MBB3185909.1 pimeloyl-ACP methyl ester carboxylesterase [Microbacter margulisiae]
MNRLLFLGIMLCGMLSSCNGAGKSAKAATVVDKTDSCRADAKNKYEVYIPQRNSAGEKLPLLVILDAHGEGRFALNKFIPAANEYHLILVASDRVKNDLAGYDEAIQTMVDDVRQKYPAGKEIFLSGFSGGARMALGYALAHPVNGLILCGALASPDQISALRCPVISISGMDDFNFVETAQYLFQAQNMPANLKIELTHASHDWPDSLLLANEVGFLRLSCQAADLPAPDRVQLEAYCQKQQARMDTLAGQDDFLRAALIAHNMASTKVFDDVISFDAAYNRLISNVGYKSQLGRLRQCLANEMNLRQPYIDAFITKDKPWWQTQISTLNQQIKTERDAYTRDMYLRIKAFLGIACYSLGKQAIVQHDAVALARILTVYRMLEPENPDMFYYTAFIPYWKGDNAATVRMLKKALQAGYSDMNQLREDFPSLASECAEK